MNCWKWEDMEFNSESTKPYHVQKENEQRPFRADNYYNLTCLAYFPPPTLTKTKYTLFRWEKM